MKIEATNWCEAPVALSQHTQVYIPHIPHIPRAVLPGTASHQHTCARTRLLSPQLLLSHPPQRYARWDVLIVTRMPWTVAAFHCDLHATFSTTADTILTAELNLKPPFVAMTTAVRMRGVLSGLVCASLEHPHFGETELWIISWSLFRKRTIPTERLPLVGEI
jgi:hypothetical protein